MDSFGKESEKQISSSNISEAIGRYFDKRIGTIFPWRLFKNCMTISRRIEAVLKANGGRTSY